MCGVAGIFSIGGQPVPGDDVLRRMTDAIAHRGPDDEGFYRDADVALGFRRLSIIDLKSGHQPICNEDASVWTILNGEIYNYRELTTSLSSRGHVFRTSTDTEVLVHLYEEYGEELVHHLRGMFVFCIWDARKKRLLIARDHLGIKQVFYSVSKGHLVFASEMKALMASGLVGKTIDVNALDHYLGLQYVPAPMTIYEGVRKLPPGHILSVSRDQPVAIRRYWNTASIAESHLGLDECMGRYDELLVESVKLQLRSDVPLGAFLSGGVDSSAVVAVMSELSESPVNTFTICHTDPSYDESRYAQAVADKFGTRHRTLTIGPTDLLALLPSVVDQYDEPFADSSALPTHIVSRLAREHVKVVLSGDGGDETCGGYSRYTSVMRLRSLDRFLYLKRLFPASVKGQLDKHITFTHSPWNKAVKYARNLLSSDAERHYFYLSYFRSRKRLLYGQSLAARVAPEADLRFFTAYLDEVQDGDLLRRILHLDINTYLADDILYKVDIASMANSLEVRVPLLDHKLVEFAASVPSRYKVAGTGKMFFKKLLEKRLPHETLYRKKKGFEIPIASWFKNELAPYVRDLLLSSTLLRGPHFDRPFVERMLDQHQAGSEDFGPHLWILMSLELWHRKWGGTFGG